MAQRAYHQAAYLLSWAGFAADGGTVLLFPEGTRAGKHVRRVWEDPVPVFRRA